MTDEIAVSAVSWAAEIDGNAVSVEPELPGGLGLAMPGSS